MTKKDIEDIIKIICTDDEDFEKPCISPMYLRKELEALALEQEPCEDCISRQAVLDLVVVNHTELNGVNVVMYSPLCKDIKQLPSVTPQPKTGRWILSDGYWRCSNCRGKALLKFDNFGIMTPEYIHVESNYCPNCGAKMEVEE